MDNMYDLLIRLSLFNGISHQQLLEIVGNTKLNFLKFEQGEKFISAGEDAAGLRFILSGEATIKFPLPGSQINMEYTVGAPTALAPDYLFGLRTEYPFSAFAKSRLGILEIAKPDFIKLIKSDNILLFNFLNLLSMYSQKGKYSAAALATGNIETELSLIIATLTPPQAEEITLMSREGKITDAFGIDSAKLTKTLETMQRESLLTFDDEKIIVTDRKKLGERLLANAKKG